MSVADAVEHAERRFSSAGIDTPRVDAEWVVAQLARTTRSRLHEARDVDVAELERLVRRREAREPLAYVLGEWGFRRLTLTTDRRALVPRPETETVVERALALIAGERAPRVLDVGVGSGAIALSIVDEHPGARVTGVDTSAEALSLARENAERLGLQIELRHAGVEAAADGWDLVVANPPYVAQGALTAAQPELAWEPRQALVDAGLHDELIRAARTTWLVLEVGFGQADHVAHAFAASGFVDVEVTKDLGGIDRVVEGRRP